MAGEGGDVPRLATPIDAGLRPYRRVLAVVAHPDDESFGLGALLSAFAAAGAETSVLCFTHGEASTLHGAGTDLRRVRAREFERAAATLGAGEATLLDLPDGGLPGVPLDELAAHVARAAVRTGADALLAFDENGVTGHPDHRRATESARLVGSREGVDVLAWSLPAAVAAALNAEFGTAFRGRSGDGTALRVAVDRRCQLRAIRCHASQATENPVLWRRLELLGDSEWLRLLP